MVRIVTLYTSILSVFFFGIWLSAVEILPNVNGDWHNFRAPGYVSFVNMASLATSNPTVYIINVREHQRGDKKMDNPEKQATLGTQDEGKQNKKTHHYMQTNTNNVNKIWAHLQTTGGRDEPNIVFMRKS